MSISKIKEINKKFDEKFGYIQQGLDNYYEEFYGTSRKTDDLQKIKSFYTQQILSLIEELEVEIKQHIAEKCGCSCHDIIDGGWCNVCELNHDIINIIERLTK